MMLFVRSVLFIGTREGLALHGLQCQSFTKRMCC